MPVSQGRIISASLPTDQLSSGIARPATVPSRKTRTEFPIAGAPFSPVCNPCSQLREARAARIEQRVKNGGAAAGHENLVDLVGRGIKRGDEDCQKSPMPFPALSGHSDSAKEQHAENKIFAYVSAFADDVVQR